MKWEWTGAGADTVVYAKRRAGVARLVEGVRNKGAI